MNTIDSTRSTAASSSTSMMIRLSTVATPTPFIESCPRSAQDPSCSISSRVGSRSQKIAGRPQYLASCRTAVSVSSRSREAGAPPPRMPVDRGRSFAGCFSRQLSHHDRGVHVPSIHAAISLVRQPILPGEIWMRRGKAFRASSRQTVCRLKFTRAQTPGQERMWSTLSGSLVMPRMAEIGIPITTETVRFISSVSTLMRPDASFA